VGCLVKQDADVWPGEPVLAQWSRTLAHVEGPRCLVGVDTDVGGLLLDEPGSHEPEQTGGNTQPTALVFDIEPLELAVEPNRFVRCAAAKPTIASARTAATTVRAPRACRGLSSPVM
jgi:hypothetical protein